MNAVRCDIIRVARGGTRELAFAAADEGRVLVVEFVRDVFWARFCGYKFYFAD